jgi:ankyrin repeat protein
VLIEAGSDLEAPSRNTEFAQDARPLHSAAAAKQLDVCRTLLAAGADPNAVQHGGYTPLREAEENGDEELAELLRQHGATG